MNVFWSFNSRIFYGMAIISLLLQSTVFADMRCNMSLVSEGDSTYEVQKKCGPPANREVIPATPSFKGSESNHSVTVENWVYGPQNGAFRQLKFIDGKLVNIKFSR